MLDRDRIAVSPDVMRQMMGIAREFRVAPTPTEARLWAAVRNRQLNGAKFRRQQQIGPFIVDFFCPEHRLIVEVDGTIHETQGEHDEERQRMLESCGYHVVRVSAYAVMTDLSNVLVSIARHLDLSRSPSPRDGEGAGG
jgi:adenine-specific DNA-methyltransferase